MYEAIRIDKTAKVVFCTQDDIKDVCVIPEYYLQDLGIAQGIAKLLNEGKIIVNLDV